MILFLCLLGWEPRSAPPALKWLFGVFLVWIWQSGVVKNGQGLKKGML